MPTHTITKSWKNSNGGTPIARAVTVSAPAEMNIDPAVNDGTTDQAVALTVTAAKLVGAYITSNTTVTIKTNSATTPTQTLTVAGGTAVAWTASDGTPCPITADITGGLFISNSSGQQAIVQVRLLYNL